MNVMEQIAELEQAREDYRREKYRNEAKEWMMNRSPEMIEQCMLRCRDDLEVTTPTKNSEGKVSVLKEAANLLAADVSIPAEDLEKKALERYRAILELVKQNGEDLSKAYQYSVAELAKTANPFNETSLQIFVSELQLVGGLPDSKNGLRDAVSSAVSSRDHGALSFWQRNLAKVASRFHMSDHDVASLADSLENTVDTFRNVTQKTAARRLKALKHHWDAKQMEMVISRTSLIANARRSPNARQLPSWATPRERTKQERLFEKKKKIEAELLKEAGFSK